MAAHRPSDPIRVFHNGGFFYVWKPQHIHALRVRYRLVGALVGALPGHKGQGAEHGAPLLLSFEETLAALEAGIITVVDCDSADPPTEPQSRDLDGARSSSGDREAILQMLAEKNSGFVTIRSECSDWQDGPLPLLSPSTISSAHTDRCFHFLVFRCLWEQGYFLTSGIKFGGDFLCYTADPMSCHAIAIVHVLSRDRPPLRPAERSCAGRLATTARKLALLASPCESGDVCFQALDAWHNVIDYDIAQLRVWDLDHWRRRPLTGSRALKRERVEGGDFSFDD